MKRAFLTGVSRGLGMAIAHRLLSAGYAVCGCSRSKSPAINELLEKYPQSFQHIPADLSNLSQIESIAKSARLLEGVDAFISNAGVGTEGLLTLTATETIEQSLRVNLTAPILLAREAVKGMLSRGGSLVFISSVAARSGYSGLSVYSAAKAGLVGFSRALAREYGERSIRSNCILPGFLETEMTSTLAEENRSRLERRTALKRLGHPDDVVGCVEFLLSPAARYITGAELVVDGGISA